MSGSRTNVASPYARLYYALRFYLHQRRGVLRFMQILRGCLILGPLRPLAVRYYRRSNNRRPMRTDKRELFPTLDVDQVVNNLNEFGCVKAAKLPEECVADVMNYCQRTRRLQYWNPHKECEAIDRLARNETIVEIAKRYLGAEPILWLTQLKWSFGDAGERRKFIPSAHREPLQHDGNAFHYDTIDFKSLTVFVYLTNVDIDSGPHVVIEGTHKKKSLTELGQIILSDETAKKKYGQRIKVILGGEGTVLLEETSSFHKASACKTKRLVLAIDYVLQRTLPPDRPMVRFA